MSTSGEYEKQKDLKKRLEEISARGENQKITKPLPMGTVKEWKELGLDTTSLHVTFNPFSQDSSKLQNTAQKKNLKKK